ncbi:zinc finger CCCH domain-containing protein 3-like isoform X1 [Acipenser ruthenus]|uniref:zinc finger CCCH domain-containing protein 3-like isoform X1 n=2 Tax=Acipenser ruthenus TaxID=7906 RepID=UPI002740FB6A|nr:zinc finger CCCH domain-containing protein 3-like isoform X1 [Acipenser ruthenus]
MKRAVGLGLMTFPVVKFAMEENEALKKQIELLQNLINNHKSVHGDAPSASGCMAGSWRNPGQTAARNQSTTFSATYTPQVRPYAPRPAVHWRKKYSLSNQKAGPPGNNLSIAGTSDCPAAAITTAQPRVLSTKGSNTKAVTRTPNLVQPSPFAAPIQHTGLRETGAKPGSAGVRTGLATPISRSNSSQIAGEQGTSKSAGLQITLSSSSPAGGAGSSTGLFLDTSKSSSVESAALLSKTIGDCSVATGQGQIKGKSPVVVRTVLSPQAAGGASFSGPVPSAAESFMPDRRLLLSKSAGSRSVEAQGQSTDKLLPQAGYPHSIKKPSILDKAVLNPKAAVGIINSGHAHRTCSLATAIPCKAQVESKTYFIDRTASIPKPAGGATGSCCSQAKSSALSSCCAKANPEGVLQADNKPQSLTALPSGVPLSASPVKNSKYTWVKKPVQGLAEPSKARAGTSSTSAESTAMPVSPHHRPESGLAGSIFKRRAVAGQKSHKGPGQSARPLKAAKTRYTWVSTTANSAKPSRKPLSPKALEGTQKAPKSLGLKKSVTPPGAKPSKKASTSPKPSGTGSKYRWKAATAGQAAAAAKPVFKWKSEKENGERGSPGSGQPSSAEHSATGASGGSSPSLSGYKLKSRMKIIRKNSGPGSVGERRSSPGSLTVKTRFSLRRRGQVPGKRLQARGLIPIGRHKLRRLPSADTHGSARQGPAHHPPHRVIRTRYKIVKHDAAGSSPTPPSTAAHTWRGRRISTTRSLLQSRIRHSSPGYRQPPPQQPQQQRWIGGALYRVSANKLFKTSSTSDFNAKLSPRAGKCTAVTDWPGQSLPGSLGRALTTRHIASRAVQRSLAIIRQAKLKKQQKREYCMYYNRFGKCNRGEKCPFIHDPDKVAVCTRFLRGTCKQTDGSCPFSHKVSKEKMPVCSYFLKGICNNSTCPYSHVYVSRKAEVCQDFLKGYCPLGEKCKKQHTLLCPDFAKTGSCLLGSKCKLQHRQRKRPAKAPETRGVPKRVKTEQEQEQDSCVAVVAPGSEAGKDRTVEPEPEVAGPCPRLEKLPSYISLCSSPTEGEGKAGEPTGESADNTEKRLQIKPRF